MTDGIRDQLKPGARVKVTQQIAARDYAWATEIVGIVVKFEQQPTGSWFAHAKNGKLWLDRLMLKLPDGEITTLNLDQFTRIDFEAEGL